MNKEELEQKIESQDRLIQSLLSEKALLVQLLQPSNYGNEHNVGTLNIDNVYKLMNGKYSKEDILDYFNHFTSQTKG